MWSNCWRLSPNSGRNGEPCNSCVCKGDTKGDISTWSLTGLTDPTFQNPKTTKSEPQNVGPFFMLSTWKILFLSTVLNVWWSYGAIAVIKITLITILKSLFFADLSVFFCICDDQNFIFFECTYPFSHISAVLDVSRWESDDAMSKIANPPMVCEIIP